MEIDERSLCCGGRLFRLKKGVSGLRVEAPLGGESRNHPLTLPLTKDFNSVDTVKSERMESQWIDR